MAQNIFEDLFAKAREIDWKAESANIYCRLKSAALRVGRVAAGQILSLYYVMTEGELSTADKLLVYAALVYIAVPGDLVPRKVFHLLGIVDDLGAVYYVWKKIQSKLTPQIEQKVDMKLDEWFGYEVSSAAR
ncbi:MAG: DUF1232 domain-containing protein [Bacteroidales bacterium]|nr:DUF1232 domain-containing protein [Bacteroides sp.]MCM1197729.1 DUF1232 domain-containing protein [Clostridium sp.]MCM1501764.1 DUF1232 domain-containing protein [Bacteroidales bacterium]